nr:MAG TPA: hypothetical protein [Caudoviricetes sp.]
MTTLILSLTSSSLVGIKIASCCLILTFLYKMLILVSYFFLR